jgi:tetratricopeptide (TPR) repeat protein
MRTFRSSQKQGVLFSLLLFFAYSLYSTENQTFVRIKRYIFQKNYDMAIYLLHKAEEKNPLDYELYLLRAEVLEKKNKPEEAVEEYKKSVHLNRKQPQIFLKIAGIYRQLNKPKEEFDYVRLFLATDKTNPELRYRSLVLSSRLGMGKYFDYAAKLFPKETEEDIEKNRTEILALQKKKTLHLLLKELKKLS